MANNLQETIKGLGFDDKEAKVYLAVLELDGASNTQIAKKSGLNRITNYEVLKRLEQKGAAASYKKKGAKYFLAHDPKNVVDKFRDRLNQAEEVLPQLLAITNKSEKKPKVYFFEGLEGIRSVYQDSLNSQTEILTFTNPDDLVELFGDEFFDSYPEARSERNIRVRSIAPDNRLGRRAQKVDKEVMRKTKLFSTDRYQINNEFMIYDDKIAMISGPDKQGLIIENKILADTFRNIWQIIWDNLEKIDE